MDRKNLEFASLLHDIGKFSYRAENNFSSEYKNLDKDDFGYHGAHSKWSASFIKHYWNSDITNLALYHHNPKSGINEEIGLIIQKADHHSSGERIDSIKNDPFKTPLLSIFSDILIKPEKNKKCDELYVPLEEFDLNRKWKNSIPTSIDNAKKGHNSLKKCYSALWEKFESEVKHLENTDDFNTILALLKKYTSCMPSATWGSKPDISLYDHSKTTAAIAVCRYLFNEETELKHTSSTQEVYSVISGDISGIQNFIFKISSPQKAQSAMSKRLRGRSLYLTLLTDAIANKIVQDLDLTQANILFCGGGRFTILAPNTEKAKKSLNEIQKEINAFFIEKFNAELYLAIASEECSGNGLENFSDITSILSYKIAQDKKHKFIDNLDDLFDFEEDLDGKSTCAVCGNLFKPKDEEDKFCDDCEEHIKLGSKVTNASYMIKCFFNEEFKNIYDKNKFKKVSFYEKPLNIAYIFTSNTSKKSVDKTFKEIKDILSEYDEFVDRFEIIKLNDTDFLEIENKFSLEELDKISFSFSFLGNTIPKYHNRNPLYFEHLAQISKGANKLGVLKMDVDDLGMIFGEGFNHAFKDSDESISSISRISTLSSQLDLFFSGFINKIASEFCVYDDGIKEYFKNDPSFFELNFKEVELKLQNDDGSKNEDESIIVYKEKYGMELDDEIKESIKEYSIPTIHINYSGGDDLLVLGPYDDIIEFSQELRTRFKQWTCNNDSINLSGGINIVSSKFPIGKAVIMAENYLEASKSCGKDKLTVFNEVVPWDAKGSKFKDFNQLHEFGLKLEEYNSQNKLSKSIVYSMLYLWKDNFEEHSGIFFNEEKWEKENFAKCNNNRFVPKFAYRLRGMNQNSKEYDVVLKEGIKYMPWIKIPVSWVSLRMR
ncbi:CRISPR-associated protein Csm1 family [Methanobrevibacter ruminantium M1]|uniref:CRISPR system single-strand-specific deoxyribonuclease Cas10/Csm1 (subtype III-A) n=1 Tax=Methanobrevibacter ruminantium (strain ATCC 35063 / DSM 1093 / JCM 13430 / OCM 146 / M1) TaxID=634498 RepID=D3E3C2_METRM|nr:type III-A CRISPR-associated protein Cas10/Csm1 [Methanobrevibacter ruminantium]ADC47033.1 CRISPR-associated protein Csm1 family [Methanobrevibacter ruminantium M1]